MKIFTAERVMTPSLDLVKPSMQLLRKYFWQTMYLSFLPALLMSAAMVMLIDGTTLATGDRLTAGVLVLLIATIWSALTSAGFFYLQTQAVIGNDISTSEAFKKGLPRIIPLLLSSILAVSAILVGLLAFVIPGLLLIRGLILSPYYVVGQKLGPVEALKCSYQDSRPVTASIWGLIGVQMLFSLIGSVLAVIPVVGNLLNLASRYAYIFGPALRYHEIVSKVETTAPKA